MNKARLLEILENFNKVVVGVIGDFSLDAYWLLDTGQPELSLETSKPTEAVIQQRYSLGAAGNVVNNLVGLGIGKISVFGVVSDDLFGREMLLQLKKQEVNIDGMMLQNEGWDTAVYAKPYLGMDEQNRVDFGRFNSISQDIEQKLIDSLKKEIKNLDALIINQQLHKGIYSKKIVDVLNNLAADNPDKIILLDSRNRNEEFSNMIFKLNASEAARVCGDEKDMNEVIAIPDLKKYLSQIYNQSKKAVFVTRGRRGIILNDGTNINEIPGIQLLKKIDSVGAGDTTVATIASVLASGGTYYEAGLISNLASAITVQKLQQTGIATPEEILNMWEDADYIYRPELADDSRHAKYSDHTEIEIVDGAINMEKVEHAIFDHDGTISSLRQGWENIMEPLMIRSILGDAYETVSEEEYHRVLKRVRDYIDQSTGIETIHQMQALSEMVAEFGFVPKDKILSAKGYKQNYNNALMEMVNQRLERLRNGELDVSDFTIKGAVKFLHYLYDRGVKLYLASGTDHDDVVHEAENLGYANLFEGRIYGYSGDASKNTKRFVVQSIIRDNNLSGSQLVAFGDGPVELRETKKQGGIAVGIASNEIRRYGLNLTKRARVIKAGADIVIPDFSQNDKIKNIFFGKNGK